MTKEEFLLELEKLGITLTSYQQEQLKKFYHLLISWNEKINLTRITSENEVYLKHFYDSLTITKVIDLNKVNTLCDVGTGAGFPGIVLKIVYPNLKITLVDALQKRCAEKGFMAGVRISDHEILFAATEKNSREDIDNLIKIIKEDR